VTDISRWTRVLKRSVTQLVPVALAGTLVVVVAADTTSAETLKHLQTQLNKPKKVRAGSLPGHPDKDIRRPTLKIHGLMPERKPPPPVTTINKLPSDHSDQLPRCKELPSGSRGACRQ
jgi:hypothetical protein